MTNGRDGELYRTNADNVLHLESRLHQPVTFKHIQFRLKKKFRPLKITDSIVLSLNEHKIENSNFWHRFHN